MQWVFENRVLREIFGLKIEEVRGDWRKLHNGEDVARVIRRKHTEDCVEET
jgi:ketosteroid isomerase-like protein